ncbi:MAG: putative transposase [Gammaproteobacteria bacterium]|nr:putative transposase [Gammaproteobacteria bacterium]
MVSDDLELEGKVADIIGLYLHPPQHAAVFGLDEKPSLRVTDWFGENPPRSAGASKPRDIESHRHGALSLYAAFGMGMGEVLSGIHSHHTAAAFVAFLTDVVASQSRGKEIHVVADNLTAHRTLKVNDFLQAHQTVHLHFVPRYSSWLKQVDQWLSKIERDIIAIGALNSGYDLNKKLMRHIRQYNKAPRTLKWKHFDPARSMAIDPDGTVH